MAIKPIEILIRAKDEFSGVLGSMQTKLTAIALAIAGFFGISLFAGAVKSAAEFEAALSKVQAATDASVAEMEQLKKAAEDAGANTKYTAVEAAEALETLAKSGLSATDAIKALPAVLDLAQAGGVDLAQASEYMTKAVMGLGLSFDDAGRVADVLAKGANASNTSVKGLAEALSYAAPVANSLGMSLEATVAIIGKFADAGIDASRAGTALNSIMSQFLDPASKFREELANAGITTTDFEKALHQLAAAGPAGSKAINAVGQEAGPALRALLNQGMGALDELKGKLNDAAGSAKETAAVMGNNLNGALSGFASAWDTVKNVLGTPVLPILKDAVDQLSGALRGAVSDGTIQKFGEAIAAAFQSGVKWAREFLATIDFNQLAIDLRAFADRAGEVFTQIGTYASNAGNIVQTAYGVMSAGVNVVMTAVYGIGAAFAGVASNIQSGIAGLYDLLAKVTFGGVSDAYKQAADSIRLSAEATWAASEELEKKASAAFVAVERGAVLARDGFNGLTDSATTASGAVAASKPALDAAAQAVADLSEEMRKEAEAAYIAMDAEERKQDANLAAAQAAEENRAAIATLRAEYATLIASGDLQGAVAKLGEINAKLRETPAAAGAAGKALADTGKAAADAAAAMEAAYKDLGITTDAALKEVADRAKTNFDLLANSGKASARELALGFEDAAKKAIDANNGIAPSWVAAGVAARGYTLEVDAAGKASLSAMGAAGSAIGQAISAHQSAAGAASAHATAVDGVARAYTGAGAAANSAADNFAKAKAEAEKTNNPKKGQTGGDGTTIPVFETMAELDTWVERWKSDFRDDNREFLGSTEYIWYQRVMDQAHKKAAQALKSREAVKKAGEDAKENAAEEKRKKEETFSTVPQKTGGTSSQSGMAPSSPSPAPPPVRPPPAAAAAPTYISNVRIDGVGAATLRFADADSQRQNEDLLRKLAQAKGVAQ